MIEADLGGAASTKLVQSMARTIQASKGIILTCHVNPDGDAIGSEVALYLALRRLGKAALVVNNDPAPRKYAFLDPDSLIEVLTEKPRADAFPGVDLGILLDTSVPSRTGLLEERFFLPELERICIDHHPGPPSSQFKHHWVAPAAPSTGTMVLRLLDELDVGLDLEIATALFVAIATDTGWFRFSNTLPSTLVDAARLLEQGVKPDSLYQQIYENFQAGRIVLLGRLLSDLDRDLDGRFVWSVLDRATLEQSGVPHEELEGFSEQLKAIDGVEVSATLLEVSTDTFKVSLRARGNVAVNAIASSFGGGGHEKAAGCRMTGRVKSVLAALGARVKRALEEVES